MVIQSLLIVRKGEWLLYKRTEDFEKHYQGQGKKHLQSKDLVLRRRQMPT
jgi:hypothetical protein